MDDLFKTDNCMEEKKVNGFFDGNPKMIFIFGIVTGIAIMAIFGGGISLPSGNNGSVRTFDVVDENGNTDDTAQLELAPVTADEHIRGDVKDAKVVIVEYSDFECPYCGAFHPNMLEVMDTYGDDVAWVYRHFPLSFHPEATPSAIASECAAEQDAFWEYADELFANQDALSDDYYVELAGDLGLNVGDFTDCYESDKYKTDVSEDLASGRAAGVSGTPATFVNGVMVSGAVPFETLADIIDQMLAE